MGKNDAQEGQSGPVSPISHSVSRPPAGPSGRKRKKRACIAYHLAFFGRDYSRNGWTSLKDRIVKSGLSKMAELLDRWRPSSNPLRHYFNFVFACTQPVIDTTGDIRLKFEYREKWQFWYSRYWPCKFFIGLRNRAFNVHLRRSDPLRTLSTLRSV